MRLDYCAPMLIRNATKDDALAIAYLHAESWRTTYRNVLPEEYLEKFAHRDRLAVWQERFSEAFQRPMVVLVAEADNQVVGFACIFPGEDAVYGSFLDNLHVAAQMTSQGIGRKLLSEGARYLVTNGTHSGLWFWVIEANYRARRFYERAGAVVAGTATIPMPDGQRVAAVRYWWANPASLVL